MTLLKKAVTLPKNYPPVPVRFPLALFRAQLDASHRYLFEGELHEALITAGIPVEVLSGAGDAALNVGHVSTFVQELKIVVGPEKALTYGHDAFNGMASLLPRIAAQPVARSVSTSDKLFLRVREAIAILNRQTGSNFIVKWHGGAESDLFEDSGQHCYGYSGSGLACQTLTGYVQEAISYIAGIKMTVTESECMATGAGACRWHCNLA